MRKANLSFQDMFSLRYGAMKRVANPRATTSHIPASLLIAHPPQPGMQRENFLAQALCHVGHPEANLFI